MKPLKLTWVYLALIAISALAFAFLFDVPLFFFLNNLAGKSTIVDSIIIFFAHFLAYILGLLLLLYVLFNKKTYQEKFLLGVSILLAGLIARYAVAETLRYFWHRPRPFLSHEATQLLSESSYSFPSGHATFFFATSTAIYFHNKKLGVFLFIATTCMTLGRIAAGVHYPSDIVAGAIIGIMCGWLTYTYFTPLVNSMLKKNNRGQ